MSDQSMHSSALEISRKQSSSQRDREADRDREKRERESDKPRNKARQRKMQTVLTNMCFFMYLSFYLQMDALYPSDTTRLRKTCSSDAAGSPWLVCRKLVLRFCIAPAHLCRQALVCHIAESERDLGGCSKMWLLHLEDRSRRHEA